jgi:uncharacterized repeat protein (TIGR01451 family)
MSKMYLKPFWRFLSIAMLLVLVLSVIMVGNAGAEGSPHPQVPGYPKYGCYEIVTAGVGMWSGNSLYPIKINVPGPVVDAYLVWVGTEDVGAPDSPNKSNLGVNGVTVIGDRRDTKTFPSSSTWYMWRADIGPNGANLVKQGYNEFNLTGWFAVPSDVRRNGASVVTVYDTGACARPNQIDLIDNIDWYWQRTGGEQTTTVTSFTFAPAPTDRVANVWLNHAGTDHNFPCRPENTWVATGTGAPPTSIIQYGNPSTGINGGVLGINFSFSQPPPVCNLTPPVRTFHAPVISVGGGFLDPEWSVDKAQILIPAGATWLALQAESVLVPNATGVEDTGESGAWFIQAAIPLFNPELKVAKTDGRTTANPGDTLTYTINYDNHGNGPATNTTLVDTLPPRTTFVSATNGGANSGNTVTWNLGTLNNGSSGSTQVTVKLEALFPAGTTTLTNTVKISTDTPGEVDLTDNTATDTTNVTAQVTYDIAKSAAPEPVDAGGDLAYTVNWSIGGNAYAPGVTIVDSLPISVTFVSASDGGVYNPGTHKVTWTLTPDPTTPPKAGSYKINVKAKSPLYNGDKIVNNVTISDTAGNSKSASATSTVRSSHALQLAKVAAPEPVDAGANLTYTITWGTTGNEPAGGATIVDTLPMSVTFVSASNGGVYNPATRKVTWNLGEVMTPQTGNVNLVVSVDSPLYNGTKLTNSAVFDDSSAVPPAQANVVSTVRADHEFAILKTAGPDPVAKGAQLFYTITWSLQGNEPADNVTITDPLPFGTKFVSASNGGAYVPATGKVVWNLGTQKPPQNGTVSFVVEVNKDFPNGLDIQNQVTISSSRPGKEKTASATTKVVQTGLGLIGDTVWYDTNKNGVQDPGEPGIAGVGLILSGAGPDGQCNTADDAVLGNTVTDANGRYAFGGLSAGKYCVKVIDSTVPAGLTQTHAPAMPVTLTEGQEYRDADFGYGPTGQSGTIGDLVWSDANGNGKRDPGEVGIGNVTLDLINAGADGKCNTADDSVFGSTTTGNNGFYLFTNVPAGKYCVKVTDKNNALTGLTLTGGSNPNGPITLPAGGSYLDADFGYQGLSGQIGNLVFYDVNRNGIYEPASGDTGIGGVTINLTGSGGVVLASTTTDAAGSYLFSGLPAGQYQVVVTDLAGRLTGYTQTYGVPNTDNNGQVSPFSVTLPNGGSVLYADFAYADGHILAVTKVDDAPGGVVDAGGLLVYTIGYGANGREPAPNVRLYDMVPTQVDFVSASNSGAYDATTRRVTWNLGNLAPGTSGTVTLTVRVKKSLANNSYVFNTATIIDDAGVKAEATDITRVRALPTLSLTKTNDPTGEVKPGDTIKYTLCYGNTGNGAATGASLVDTLPPSLTYVAGSATGLPAPVYDEAANTLTWNLGTLAIDANGCVGFSAKVAMTIANPTVQAKPLSFAEWNSIIDLVNKATLSCNEVAPVSAEARNPLNFTVDPSIIKTASSARVQAGDPVVFTVSVTNRGNANATGVKITDAISPKLIGPTFTASKGSVSFDPTTRLATWTIDVLTPGETVSMTISGRADTAGQLPYQITNFATIVFNEGNPRQSNVVVVDVYAPTTDIPEPGTWLLLGTGLAGVAGYARMRVRSRRRKA